MYRLIPSNTYDLEQLWALLIRRNRWIVNLRYIVFISLSIFTILTLFVIDIELSTEQCTALIVLSAVILFYNVLFQYILKTDLIKNDPDKFNQVHFSLIQIFADIIALAILIYYTGGIESPFYVFFIFHMIIGSLLLPGYVIYTIASGIVICFYTASLLEYFTIIPHHKFGILLNMTIYNNLEYNLIFATSFGIMLIVSVFLANSIARALYIRDQELKITLDKLDKAEVIKQKYTMGIVHEIKSPLASVQSYLDLILQKFTGPISQPVEDKLQKARNRTDEAIQIINDVLNISRLRLQTSLNKDDINIAELLNKLIIKKKIQGDYSRIGINFYDLRSDKCTIKGDYSLIGLAFSNLIGNAIKYSNFVSTIEIVIEDGREENEIRVEVCDNGIGIPEKDKLKIFREFYRASNVKEKNYEGTGLGLSVVKLIIEQHEGEITFESPSRLANEIGPGTCFKVFLKRN